MDILAINTKMIEANRKATLAAAKTTHEVSAERIRMIKTTIYGAESFDEAKELLNGLMEMVCDVHNSIEDANSTTKKRLRENFRKSWIKSAAGDKNSAFRFQLDFAFLPSSTTFELNEWKEAVKAPCKACTKQAVEVARLAGELVKIQAELTIARETISIQANRYETIENEANRKGCKLGDLKKAING